MMEVQALISIRSIPTSNQPIFLPAIIILRANGISITAHLNQEALMNLKANGATGPI